MVQPGGSAIATEPATDIKQVSKLTHPGNFTVGREFGFFYFRALLKHSFLFCFRQATLRVAELNVISGYYTVF